MEQNPNSRVAQRQEELYADDSISIGNLVRIFRSYRQPILLSILAILLLYALIAAALYLFSHKERIVSLPFRLEFRGAEQGNYPNGARFATNDIVATPVLRRVFENNGLERYMGFRDFAGSLFVVESNEALERLTRDYQSKLTDRNLTMVDRERLEQEFEQKRQSLSKSQYSLNFHYSTRVGRLPAPLVNKTLTDVLATWAERAEKENGVVRYPVPVVTANILNREMILAEDPVVALDILRSKVNEISRNISTLLSIPGAEVLRTEKERIALHEIRLNLEDVTRLRLRPLFVRIQTSGLVENRREARLFFETQLKYNQLRHDDMTQRHTAIQQALETYRADTAPSSGDARPSAGRPNDAVAPQLSESFLERVIALSGQSKDRDYRQQLVEEMKAASLGAIPFENEVRYYRDLITDIDRAAASGPGPSREADLALVRRQLDSAFEEIATALRQVNEIYDLVSSNLNSSGALYRTVAPPTQFTQRSLSLTILGLIGLFVFLFSVPLVVGGALLHNRLRNEEQIETGSTANAGTAPGAPLADV